MIKMMKMINMMNVIKMMNRPLALVKMMKLFIKRSDSSCSSSEAIDLCEGFTLIETLVGVVILTGVLLGPVTFLSSSFTRAHLSEEKLTALYLAEEGIELTRRIRDNNVLAEQTWNNGLLAGNYEIDYDSGFTPYSAPGTKLLYDVSTGAYSYNSGSQTSYVRRVTLSAPAADQLQLISVVTWTDRQGNTKTVQLQEILYNWL